MLLRGSYGATGALADIGSLLLLVPLRRCAHGWAPGVPCHTDSLLVFHAVGRLVRCPTSLR